VLRIGQQRALGVRVRVDEARPDGEPAGVDDRAAAPRSSIAAIVSPRTPTSVRRPGPPDPSTTVPPRTIRSNIAAPRQPQTSSAVSARTLAQSTISLIRM